jgi:hypothetical protein
VSDALAVLHVKADELLAYQPFWIPTEISCALSNFIAPRYVVRRLVGEY